MEHKSPTADAFDPLESLRLRDKFTTDEGW
jgi:hypothetical protein